MHLTADVGAFHGVFLDLEYQASRHYAGFVYDDLDQMIAIRDFLFSQRVSEFSPPHGQLLIHEGLPSGMIAWWRADELKSQRLRATLVLHRSPWLQTNPPFIERLRLGAQTLLKLADDDFYLSRIAIAQASRGRGAGDWLLERFAEAGQHRGCRRLALEVSGDNPSAMRLFARHRFRVIGSRRASDPATGRSLEYIHMARSVTES